MTLTGRRVERFRVPVCSAFKRKIYNNQLCYEFDIGRFKEKKISEDDLKKGLTFLLDYNEDRQLHFRNDFQKVVKSNDSLVEKLVKFEYVTKALVHIEAKGRQISLLIIIDSKRLLCFQHHWTSMEKVSTPWPM